MTVYSQSDGSFTGDAIDIYKYDSTHWTRGVAMVLSSDHVLVGEQVSEFKFYVKKIGSPLSATIKFGYYDSVSDFIGNQNTLYSTQVSNIATTEQVITCTPSSPITVTSGMCFGIETSSENLGDSNNHRIHPFSAQTNPEDDSASTVAYDSGNSVNANNDLKFEATYAGSGGGSSGGDGDDGDDGLPDDAGNSSDGSYTYQTRPFKIWSRYH